MILLSIPGLLKTLLIIVGIFVVIRFLNQFIQGGKQSPKNKEDEQKKPKGKTSILKDGFEKDAQDVDFEEME